MPKNYISNIFNEFGKKALSCPDAQMVITDDFNYSYRQIYSESVWYAKQLREALGGTKGRVLLEFKHTYKIIVAILAVLHEGCSYVPIRQSDMLDLDRIATMTGATVIMSDRTIDNCGLKQIAFEDTVVDDLMPTAENALSGAEYASNDEVYVLFTSGSTGTPKGCSISMHNLNYLISNMQKFNCPDPMVYGFTTPYTFDVSTSEIFSFLYGAKIAMIDIANFYEFSKFPELISKLGITHLSMSPSGFSNVIRSFSHDRINRMCDSLKYVFIAGEAFRKSIWESWKKNNWSFRLYNMYGPTEATVYATMYELKREESYDKSIPIGYCLKGAHYIIDGENNTYGELIIGGVGISNGYINAPKETDMRFFEKESVRYYRTGDYVSLNNGLLIYHGRKDDQVQINGIRVELGEIAARIKKIEYIEEAVVLSIDNEIVAFIQIVENSTRTLEEVKEDCSLNMPRYMLPNVIITIKQFELTDHGKINRKKLTKEYKARKKSTDSSSSKSSHEASTILNIMNGCFGETRMNNIYDDFYEAGADSLATVAVAIRIIDDLGYSISPDDIYSLRSPKKIAEHFSNAIIISSEKNHENNEDLLRRITKLSQDINKYLYAPNTIINEYPTIHLQYYYYLMHHHYVIPFVFKLQNTEINDAAAAICRVIAKNRILGSSIIEKDGRLYFRDHAAPQASDIPVIYCDLENAADYIIENYEKEVYYARYLSGRLALFIIVKHNLSLDIVGILDHSIADSASISILKQKLSQEINHIDKGPCLQYEDYCNHLRAKNADINKAIDSAYIKGLRACKVVSRVDQISSIPDRFTTVIIDNEYVANSIFTIFQIIYRVGKSYELYLSQNDYALRTIINLREFKDYSYNDTIGDMHISISFIYSKGIMFDDFVKRCEDTIKFFTKNTFFPDFMKHKMMLPADAAQLELKTVLTDCKLFSINYIGEVSENEIEKTSESVRKLQSEWYNEERRIYITAVTCGKKIFIFSNKGI